MGFDQRSSKNTSGTGQMITYLHKMVETTFACCSGYFQAPSLVNRMSAFLGKVTER